MLSVKDLEGCPAGTAMERWLGVETGEQGEKMALPRTTCGQVRGDGRRALFCDLPSAAPMNCPCVGLNGIQSAIPAHLFIHQHPINPLNCAAAAVLSLRPPRLDAAQRRRRAAPRQTSERCEQIPPTHNLDHTGCLKT